MLNVESNIPLSKRLSSKAIKPLIETLPAHSGWRDFSSLNHILRMRYPLSIATATFGATAAVGLSMSGIDPAIATEVGLVSMIPVTGVSAVDFLGERNKNLKYVERHEGLHAIPIGLQSDMYTSKGITIKTTKPIVNIADPEKLNFFCADPAVEIAFIKPKRVWNPETIEDATKVGIAHMIIADMPAAYREMQIGYNDQEDACILDKQQIEADISKVFPGIHKKDNAKIQRQVRESAKALLKQTDPQDVNRALRQIAKSLRSNNGCVPGEKLTEILKQNHLLQAMPPLTNETIEKAKFFASLETKLHS